MSKSTGNLVFVKDLLAVFDPMAVRLAVMSQHYRSTEWTWSDELLVDATDRLELWRSAGSGSGTLADVRPGLADVRRCLDNDLDVPGALTMLDEAARSGGGVSEAAALLGVVL